MTNELRGLKLAGCLVIACGVVVAAGAQTPPAQKPKIKVVTAIPITSVEGADNFAAYCAVCHGREGKGDGPAAPAMKVPVPDLTTIAKRNNGKFNATLVEFIIRGTGKTPTPAHGVEDMPIWGEVFHSEDKARSTLQIGNLVKYVESLQVGTGAPR